MNVRKKIFSIWSVVLVLVVSLAVLAPGCGDGETYDLTMAVAPPGSGTATDLTGASPYAALTAVNISAVAASGYQFVEWTAPAGLFGDKNAAQTTFIMQARNVTVTANFELVPPDHFKFYQVYWEEPEYINKEVQLVDQFGTFTATVKEAALFGNPVEKEHTGVTPISDDNRHYTLYYLDYDYELDSVTRDVEVSNQFQDKVELTVYGPYYLAVPTQKEGHEMGECLNHYLVYYVDEADAAEFPPVDVNLKDQFIPDGEDVTVEGPYLFANPVKKTVVGGDVAVIEDPDLHWVLYDIWDAEAPSIEKKIEIDNQFGNDQILDLTKRDVLAVPSEKIVPPTPLLDHFKCYQTLPQDPLEPLLVNLQDQFHSDYLYDVEVLDPMMFCNPVDKVHGTVETSSNPDNHLTVYKITTLEEPDWWTVTVDNQFSDAAAPQTLIVTGPVALAVPTQKLEPGDHGLPKYLDHYLLYEVWEPVPVNVTVDLDDQFPEVAENVTVTTPMYFANPVVKGYVDHAGLWDPDEHLVFYAISDNGEFFESVQIKNQFFWEEPVPLNLIPIDQLLAVPSVKVDWAPTGSPIT